MCGYNCRWLPRDPTVESYIRLTTPVTRNSGFLGIVTRESLVLIPHRCHNHYILYEYIWHFPLLLKILPYRLNFIGRLYDILIHVCTVGLQYECWLPTKTPENPWGKKIRWNAFKQTDTSTYVWCRPHSPCSLFKLSGDVWVEVVLLHIVMRLN